MPRLSKIGAAALAAFGWTGLQTVTADFLVVAGGAGGGGAGSFNNGSGGGGAGGFRTSAGTSGGGASAEGKLALNPTQSYTVTVGAGGAAATGASGNNGSDSVFSTITSTGGGGGAIQTGTGIGKNGGSGGGGASGSNNDFGTGTANQGYRGGSCTTGSGNPGGGGGGGAGAVGGNGSSSVGGNGGNGVASSITGSSVTYAGGGGGGVYSSGTAGTGGSGGGGNGNVDNNNGFNGSANTGGGGGGSGSYSATLTGGAGGSGIVIISYVGAQQFGGGVVTSSGGNTIHTFNTSGTLSPLSQLTANFLVVAGGGGGGAYNGGGGGAGGLRSSVTNTGGGGSLESSLTIDTNSTYLVTVGAGGSGQISSTQSVAGSDSSFLSITSVGGGRGGGYTGSFYSASTGGSGGGAPYAAGGSGAAGTTNQGFAGGNGDGSVNSGGGGGAGAVGGNATASVGGNGGVGVAVAISGTSTFYAGGGGGAGYPGGGGAAGTGGNGGGGNGGANSSGTAGTANRGGGGGGSQDTNNPPTNPGGNGGSGIVIISYAGSTPQMAGGTVTVSGGNVIHTFTSSGYLSPIVNLNNSLRFRNTITGSPSNPAYLSRTFPTAGNLQKWTFSVWIKKTLGRQTVFGRGSSQFGGMQFDSTDTLSLNWASGGTTYNATTTQVFRDPSAWYHLVWAIDTTQSVSTARQRLYVNGSEVTAWSTYTTIPQNTSGNINTANSHWIGRFWESSFEFPFSGYMTDINFVDGQQLTANSFGAYNGQGVWQPVRYGGSYGTNGFYLPFNTNASGFSGVFNGSNQYLTTATTGINNFGTGNFTVEAYINLQANSAGQIVSAGDGSTTNAFYWQYYSGQLQFGIQGVSLLTGYTWTPNLNTWYHVAVVRSGSTITQYINGVSVSSTTSSHSFVDGPTWIANGGAGYFNGLISNVRINKGNALYTANFTPSTSPLTAVSGTTLLTCQSSTFIDNSGNSYAITNNNSATIAQTYPFAYAIFNDQGPAGNNWTPNNIQGGSGSNLDYMTDVPTNTSATVANYCVWSPINKSSTQNVTNGNLTASSSGGTSYGALCATMGVTSGKWYWEMTYTRNGTTNSPVIGFGNDLFNYTNPPGGYLGSDLNAGGINVFNGNAAINGTSTAYGSAIATNDIVMFAMDLDSRKFYVGKNGTWFNSGNPVSGTNSWPYSATIVGSTFFPAVNMFNDTGDTNFGQRPFTYTPPTGFVALNTFNLPTPTIGATPATTANKYFDTTLYTGNSTTNTITNSGSMQPDFVWIKSRSNTQGNDLFDSVRGAGYALFSNATNAETNNTANFTSFNSNGFSLASNGGDTNFSGYTYVAWQWRASNTTAVTNTNGSITSSVSANTTAGFSIVTYTGNGTNGSTVGHGLGVAPSLMFVKDRSQGGTYRDWAVYSPLIGAGNSMYLNDTSGSFSKPSYWNSTTATSTVFTLGNDITVNQSGDNFVAYCFTPIAGYSAIGSYTGNGSSDGPFVFTGFRPRYVLIKCSNTTGDWWLEDTSRNTYNAADLVLFPNTSGAESGSGVYYWDFLSNGFKLRSTSAGYNGSGNTYIYMAFAESPFKYSNAR